MKRQPIYGSYMGYLIIEERYSWGSEVSAIPDSGETIRQKFIGYTKKEIVQKVRDLIKESCK
jgi:hypothetical protein